MKILLTFAMGCALTLGTVGSLIAQALNHSSVTAKPAVKDLRNLPLGFEANQGQADPAVRFLARGAGYGIYLTEQEIVLAILPASHKHGLTAPQRREKNLPPDVVRMKLAGGNATAHPDGLERLPGVANYFIGNDPSKWRTDVPTYAEIRYPEVYPGVDLLYYGNQQQLEYDFVVAPGESAAPIRLSFNGARLVKLDGAGNLVLKSRRGVMVFRRPVAYQVIGGKRHAVESRFRLLPGKSAGFRLGSYDHTAPLIIDPVIVYSSLLGGNGLGGAEYGDAAVAIATDAQGNAYVTGYTDSSDFPVSNPYDGAYNSVGGMAFVSKINASGSAFIYSTFLGGTQQDSASGIAVDSSGNAYVTGTTFSSDFPVVNAIQSSIPAGVPPHGFVTKIGPLGQTLVYSTYLGGSGNDYPSGIAVDPSGNAYIAGYTSSQDFPTYKPLQPKDKATTYNPLTGFVSKIDPAGTAFVYSTYLGGSNYDAATGIAADSTGNAYVSGYTGSSDFPLYQPLQSEFHGSASAGSADPFLSKIKPDGSGFVYSTFVGGGSPYADEATGVAADATGNAYLVGKVIGTTDLPLVNPLQTELGIYGYGAFLSKVNPEGTAFVYSTFIGDTNGALGVAVDGSGNAYVTGQQYCPWDLPVPVKPVGTCSTSGPPIDPNIVIEAFIYEVAADGSAFTFATPFGGGGEYGYGIAVDPSGNVYVAGQTKYAAAFPTINALDKTAEGTQEGFVLKLDMAASAPEAATPAISPITGSYTTSQTVSIKDTTPNAAIYYTKDGTTPTISSAQFTGTFTVSSTETVKAIAFANGYSDSAVATAVITIATPAATPVIAPGTGTYSAVQTVSITDTTAGATIYYTTNGTMPTTKSTVYSGPITVSSTETIEAIAAATGYTNSAVASAAYTINIPVAATPTFSPSAGNYASAQTVTISDATAGAAIYYTTNGTMPKSSSTVYSGPITVSTSETIEAIAAADGYTSSAVASAAYTITEPSFMLSASPASVSVPQGSSGTSTITVIAAGGFAGTVSLATNGLPSGVTASFAAGSAAGTQVVTIAANASTAVTSSPVTLTVTGTSGTLTANTSLALTITAEPSFAAGSGGTTSMTVTPGATTGDTGTISVMGTNGFSGTVNLTCAVTTSLKNVNDMPTCSLSPTSVTISGTSMQTSTLTASTTAASSSDNRMQKPFGPIAGGAALALIAFFLVPRRWRNRSMMLGTFVLFVSVCTIGCGGGSGNGGGGGGGGGTLGTTAGTYTITVTGTAGSVSAAVGTVTLTVQ